MKNFYGDNNPDLDYLISNITEYADGHAILNLDTSFTTVNNPIIITINYIDIKYGNTVLMPNHNISLSYDNSTFFTKEMINGYFTTKFTPSENKKYLITVKLHNVTLSKEIDFRLNSNIEIDAKDINFGDTANINIKLTDIDGKPINDSVTLNVNDVDYTITTINGSATLKIDNLKIGNYDIIAKYSGNEYYFNTSNESSFKVTKATPTLIVKGEDISYGENVNIIVTLTDINDIGLNESITLTVNNNNYIIKLKDGLGSQVIPNLIPKTYNVTANYLGNDNYTKTSNSTEFKVYKSTPKLIITTENITYGENINIIVKLTGINDIGLNESITLTVNNNNYNNKFNLKQRNNQYNVNIINGEGSLIISNINADNYTINANYLGNENYTSANNKSSFKVNKAIPTLIILGKNITYGNELNIKVKLIGVNNAGLNGTVNLNINNTKYTINIINGLGSEIINNLNVGNYSVYANYKGNNNYETANTSSKFTVSKAKPKMTIDTKTEGKNQIITVILPKDAKGNVTLTLDNKSYIKSLKKGKVVFNISGLKIGNYVANIFYPGDDNFNSVQENISFTVKINDNNTDNKTKNNTNDQHNKKTEKTRHNINAVTMPKTGNPLYILIVLLICLLLIPKNKK